jgi:dihydropteroate synthase
VNIEGSRAEKTLEISKHLIKKGIEFLRVHDVKEHKSLQRL